MGMGMGVWLCGCVQVESPDDGARAEEDDVDASTQLQVALQRSGSTAADRRARGAEEALAYGVPNGEDLDAALTAVSATWHELAEEHAYWAYPLHKLAILTYAPRQRQHRAHMSAHARTHAHAHARAHAAPGHGVIAHAHPRQLRARHPFRDTVCSARRAT
jgi:hypothetical protein